MGESERSPLLEKMPGQKRFGNLGTGDVTLEIGDRKDQLKADEERVSNMQNIKRLLFLARPERSLLIIATLTMLVSAGANVALPRFAGQIIDTVTGSQDKGASLGHLNALIVQIIAIILVGGIAKTITSYLFTSTSERVVSRVRKTLFSNLMAQEVGFFDNTRTGELLSRLSEDTQVIKTVATTHLSEALRNVATATFGLGFMFVTSWHLTVLSGLIIPPVSVIVRYYGNNLRILSRKTQAASAAAVATAEEALGSLRTVRAFAQEGTECQKFDARVSDSLKLGIEQALWLGVTSGGLFSLASGAMVCVLWYGARLTIKGEMSAGALSAFVLYSLTVGVSLAAMSALYANLMRAVGASQRVFELLDRQPKLSPPGDKRPLGGGEVRLEGIWFAYPSRPNDWVLKGVDLFLHPGTRTALVGPSGGGKSTVASLVERYYDPQKGHLFLDDVPLPEIDHTYLHQRISIVSQEPILFDDSISANIAYGCPGASQQDIEQAAVMANAHDFILNFPGGYQTHVGERGVRLSGGQKQRVAIARALLMNPRVLLLDEATSALDAESEHLVQDALDKLMVGRTVLIIAHRLSTVQGADVVAVVSGGVIAERGGHEELVERDGIYASLVKRQLQAGQGSRFGSTSNVPGLLH